MVGVEDLGEEDPDGDERGVEATAEGNALVAEGLLDLVVGEQVGEGEAGGLGEAAAERADLAMAGRGGSMSHGWPPC